ncbi:disulfide bond formation protein B [Asaia platycodi]|uniref:disulfide bond formation protein B n=1 Tax=Asaia platycodi TaxID=610243 RepID=UPI000AF29828|nr:disulfide bond formation protein B [Asaia platycodi]
MIARLTGGLMFFAGFAALFAAYWAEHILGYAPCELCLIERAPWRIVAFLGVIALLIPGMVGFWATVLALPALAASVMLAGIHNGVEQKWWESLFPRAMLPFSTQAPVSATAWLHADAPGQALRRPDLSLPSAGLNDRTRRYRRSRALHHCQL